MRAYERERQIGVIANGVPKTGSDASGHQLPIDERVARAKDKFRRLQLGNGCGGASPGEERPGPLKRGDSTSNCNHSTGPVKKGTSDVATSSSVPGSSTPGQRSQSPLARERSLHRQPEIDGSHFKKEIERMKEQLRTTVDLTKTLVDPRVRQLGSVDTY